jgi:hypothetical protein
MEVNEPVETKTVKALTLQSLKRTLDLFQGNYGQRIPIDEERSVKLLPASSFCLSVPDHVCVAKERGFCVLSLPSFLEALDCVIIIWIVLV